MNFRWENQNHHKCEGVMRQARKETVADLAKRESRLHGEAE